MAWVSTAAPETEHADCLCSRPFKSCQVSPALLVPLCKRSSVHCPVTMSSSEVKSYGRNSAIASRLALLSCFVSPTPRCNNCQKFLPPEMHESGLPSARHLWSSCPIPVEFPPRVSVPSLFLLSLFLAQRRCQVNVAGR
jgi:hypothetical protein